MTRKPGRPTKLSPKLLSALFRDIRLGLSLRLAAARSGVSEPTLHRWVAENREFREALARARADRAAMLLKPVVTAAVGTKNRPGEWQASMKLLEKLEPGDFGQQVRVHVEAELDAAIIRLQREFFDEPETLRRALLALVGDEGAIGLGVNPVDGEAPA